MISLDPDSFLRFFVCKLVEAWKFTRKKKLKQLEFEAKFHFVMSFFFGIFEVEAQAPTDHLPGICSFFGTNIFRRKNAGKNRSKIIWMYVYINNI